MMRYKLPLLLVCAAALCASCIFLPSFLVSGRRPIASEEKFTVLDGKCIVTMKYNPNGTLRELTAASADPNDTTSCGKAEKNDLTVGGMPVLDNVGGITLGVEGGQPRAASSTGAASARAAAASGKMICYGPPIPSPPVCVCTSNPCP